MSVCNVIACADCGLKSVRPANCPITMSQDAKEPTIVVGIIEEMDINSYAGLGVNCFKSDRYDEVCFVQCSCPSNEAIFTTSSIKRVTRRRLGVNHETINGSTDGERISSVS